MDHDNYLLSHPHYQELSVPWYTRGTLRLVRPQLEHARSSLEWVSDEEVVRLTGGDFSGASLEGEKKRIQDILNNEDAYHWMIALNGQVVGNVSLHDIGTTSQTLGCMSASLAYLIGERRLWGQGIATAAARAVLGWAFNAGGFQVIVARVVQQNERSLAVLKRLGFEEYGTEPYAGPDFGEPTVWCCYRLSSEPPQQLAPPPRHG